MNIWSFDNKAQIEENQRRAKSCILYHFMRRFGLNGSSILPFWFLKRACGACDYSKICAYQSLISKEHCKKDGINNKKDLYPDKYNIGKAEILPKNSSTKLIQM